MKQVLIIDGGSSFDTHERYINDLIHSPLIYDRLRRSPIWSDGWLASHMQDTDVLTPHFPNAQNAVYEEWKIYFEKIIPFLGDDVRLVGHSLGAMFLAKYLHESPLQQPVRQLILLAPGYDDDTNEDLGSFNVESATGLEASAREIHLFHSKDDPVVPFTELAKFQADIPHASSHIFTSKGHFLQPDFPELLKLLQQK